MSNFAISLDFDDLTHGDLRRFVEATDNMSPNDPVGFQLGVNGDIDGFKEWV